MKMKRNGVGSGKYEDPRIRGYRREKEKKNIYTKTINNRSVFDNIGKNIY